MPTTRANSRAASVASVHEDTGPVPEPPLEADTTLRPQTLIHSPQPAIGFQPPFIQPQPPVIPGPQYYPQGSQGPYSPQFPSHGREPQFGSRGPSRGPERRYNSRAPQTEPHEGTPFEEAPNLAVALTLITKELRRRDNPSTRAKVKEPDTFDVLRFSLFLLSHARRMDTSLFLLRVSLTFHMLDAWTSCFLLTCFTYRFTLVSC